MANSLTAIRAGTFAVAGDGSLSLSPAGWATNKTMTIGTFAQAWTLPSNTASAMTVGTATTSYWTTNTQTTANTIFGHLLATDNPTLNSTTVVAYHVAGTGAPTITLTGAGTVNTLTGVSAIIQTPVFVGTAATVTQSSTLFVQGAPTFSGGMAITNPLAIESQGALLISGSAVNNLGVGTGGQNSTALFISSQIQAGSGAANGVVGVLVAPQFNTASLTLDMVGIKIFPTLQNNVVSVGHIAGVVNAGWTLPANWTLTADMMSFASDAQVIAGAVGGNYAAFRTVSATISGAGTVTGDIIGFWASSAFNAAIPAGLTGLFRAIKTEGGQVYLSPAMTIASGANATWNGILVPATTVTISGSTGITQANGFNLIGIAAPTLSAASALAVTTSATLAVLGPPVGGGAGPATITNPMSLWVKAGPVNFGSTLSVGTSTVPASGNGIFVNGTTTNSAIWSATQGAGSTQLFIGNSSINVTSDRRLKANITDTTRDALAIIGKLRVVDFDWNDPIADPEGSRNKRGRWTGMIAQEMIEHVPWIINHSMPNDLYFVEYHHLVPLLTRAIQDLTAQVNDLRKGVTHGE